MTKFTAKKNRYDNYTEYKYIDDNSVLHHVYFKKKDYSVSNSCVMYSKNHVIIEKEDGYMTMTGVSNNGTLEIVASMPRYNNKKLLAIVERIEKELQEGKA